MNGLQTLVEIRKRYPKLPVIMFSTLTERGASATLEALALGASDYASSQVDKRKAGRLAQAIQVAFQELGVFQTSNTKIPLQDDDAMPFEAVQIVENTRRSTDLKKIINPMKGILTTTSETQSLQEVRGEIQKALSPEIKKNEVSMSLGPEGLIVSLKEMGFFDSGAAEVRPEALDAISRLAAVLKGRPENLRIEGHTDNIPIHNSKFASNWELSTTRATDLIQLLVLNYGIPADHLSAAGYAQFHPVTTNDTREGRAQNRRLDVVILAPYVPLNRGADVLLLDSARAP
jgi:chemotaxis protein MotB